MKRLTPKERKVLKLIAQGESINDAVEKAYNVSSRASARNISSKLLKRRRFLEILEQHGLNEDIIIKTIVDGLNAESVVIDKQGKEHKTPNYIARLKAVDLGIRLRGLDRVDEDEEADQIPLVVRSIKFELNNSK